MQAKPLRWLRHQAGPAWILLMVMLAGLLNATGWLEFGQTLSHMTGNLTKMGLSAAGAAEGSLWSFLLMMLCFLLGATLSGYGFPQQHLAQWRRCGLVLLCCGALLALSESLPLPEAPRMYALALVLGAQNGLNLRYRGILTRTTHMTGHLTDCGSALGRMLHMKKWHGEDARLLLFHALCLLCFFLGVVIAALVAPHLLLYRSLPPLALAAAVYLIVGAGTLLYGLRAGRG